MTEPKIILGRNRVLANGAKIFVGTSEADSDAFYIGMVSAPPEQRVTKLSISNAARLALLELLSKPSGRGRSICSAGTVEMGSPGGDQR